MQAQLEALWTQLLNFVHNNDFVVVVFVLALILVVAGFVFKAFLKAAIITAVILVIGGVVLQYIPMPIEDEGLKQAGDDVIDATGKLLDDSAKYVENKLNSDE